MFASVVTRPLRALEDLRLARAEGGPLALLPGAATRTWLANDAPTEETVLLQGTLFVKNNMRGWRQAAPVLPPTGLRALGLAGQPPGPRVPETLAQHARSVLRQLAHDDACGAPLHLVQRLLTRLLPPVILGGTLQGDADAVIAATDLLEQAHGQRQLETFFGDAARADAGPQSTGEDEELEARLLLHHVFRQSYCPEPLPPDSPLLDAFIALYRAAIASPAAALVWLCRVLAAQPRLQQQLHAQLRDDGAAPQARAIARALVFETLRMFPPAWLLVRMAAQDTEFGGRSIRAGDHVLVSPWLRHRDPALWRMPEAFDPLRFRADGDAAPHKLMAFGQGARKCPAMHFSLQLLPLLAEELVLCFEMHADADADPGEAVLWVNYRPGRDAGLRFASRTS